MTFRELLAKLRDWPRRDRLDAELAEELRFHRAQLERDDGTAAIHRLGNLTRLKENTRDMWSIRWLDDLLQDIRYALRGLRRSPGFAATVILTLGLGIGANAAMFGVIDRLMFRPYPYLRDPATVDRVYLQLSGRNDATTTSVSFPYTRYLDLRRWTSSFSESAAFVAARHAIGSGEDAREHPVYGVSASFFDFFEARPAAGRYFGPAEDALPAGTDVVVLGHRFWQAELGGRNVLGETIQIGSARYQVVGVAPPGFVGVAQTRDPAVFIPITAYAVHEGWGAPTDYHHQYTWDWTEMMVRRKPGIDRDQATADLTAAFVRSRVAARAVHPNFLQTERASPRAMAGPLQTAAGPDAGLEMRTLLWVAGVAAIVLIIACANVANLYLARAVGRRRELALRLALGVSRGRLVRQALTESLLLSLIGCAAGLLAAQWAGIGLQRMFLPFASSFDVVTDWRTLGLASAAALLAAVATGVAPVLFARRELPASRLTTGSRAGSADRSHARSMLLVAQAALSVLLLVGAGLFVRSLVRVQALPAGFDPEPVLLMVWERRGSATSPAERIAVRDHILEAAHRLPAVEAAAWVSSVPMQGTSTFGLAVPGIDSVTRLGRFSYQIASHRYFDVVKTRILRGRAFTGADRDGSPPVVVVSAAMAQTLWPDRDPLGQCIRVGWMNRPPETMPCTTVIGVAEDALQDPLTERTLRYYLPQAQLDEGGWQLALRIRGDARAEAEGIRRVLQRELPGLSYLYVQAMGDMYTQRHRSWRMGATMFLAFGALALVVAAIGLYGVMGYDVAQRMHELGVRTALGAQRANLVALVLRRALTLTLAGVAAGLVLALILSGWIEPLLFRQSARDPLVYGGVSLVLVLVALIATALPTLRATRADPNTVLRSD